jgi:magnesium transporter
MIVDCAIYEDGRRRDGVVGLEHAYDACRRADGAFAWIGLYEPTEEEFDSIRREFELHELAVEDAIKAHQRPKLEVYGETLFIVLRTVRFIAERDETELGEILIFVGDGFVITVRHGEGSALHDVRLALEQRQDLLRCGEAAVLHAILDRVVDDYAPVIEALEQDVDEIEQQVFSHERMNPTARIFELKREVIEFQRAAAPLAGPLERLARGDFPIIHEQIRSYFRDVYDHLLRAVEQIDTMRDLLTGALTANMTQVGVRQNEDMRRISAWVAIIAVPTMIAGIYGMNFEHMPELGWTFGYPLAVGVMVVLCSTLYRYFRKAGWL